MISNPHESQNRIRAIKLGSKSLIIKKQKEVPWKNNFIKPQFKLLQPMQEVSYGKILQTRFYKFYTSFAKNKIPHLVALYKASTLPSLILGCEAWTMTKKRIKKPE